MRSANPTLNANTFRGIERTAGDRPMTLDDVVNRAVFLLILVLSGAIGTWQLLPDPGTIFPVATLGAFVLGIITVFAKRAAFVTAPLYSVLEGVSLGALSYLTERAYPGIAAEALGLTLCIFLALLMAYRTRLVQPSENFKLGVTAATAGLCLFYLAGFIGSFFGWQLPLIHETGLLGIGFSLFVVVLASMNLVLDFDFIEEGVRNRVPRYMAWYSAFGLVVTLVWLYVEILNLLVKLRSRD
ncbi:MAG: Bax inhibitor-1/YccA family protein [Candidatus Sericytochromatia bacterium]|nr:Bax inhibitor-1/YccA family protein [Candidatus Sericytochromatia bacterium]